MKTRSLVVESLETRLPMAGNVAAAIVNNELRITGDGAANWVQVRQVPGADQSGRTFIVQGKAFNGQFDAEGKPVAGTAVTRINGLAQDAVLFTSKDDLSINMGDGNDAIEVGSTASNSNSAELDIDTGTGRDFIGVDRLTIYGTNRAVSIRTGQESEILAETVVLNRLIVANQGLTVTTGGGNDRMSAISVSVGGSTNFLLGAGADTFIGAGLTLNIATINIGNNNDERDVVTLSNSAMLRLTTFLGDGNDLVNLRLNVSVVDRATINGGEGNADRLIVGSNIDIGDLVKISVEISNG